MSNEISVYNVVDEMEAHFNKALSVNAVSWVKECGFAKQQLMGNDSLYNTADSNRASLQHAIVNVASIGISLNPAQKHAYLVPRNGKVCLDVSYIGLLHLSMASGSIVWGQSKIVYEKDTYENIGIDKPPIHKQQTFGDKGAIVGAYCTVKLPSGDYLTEEMDMQALDKIKGTSKAANGPWKTWPEQMMRKSVVKRASNYWPQSVRVNEAIAVINEHEGLAEEYTRNKPYTEKQEKIFFSLIESDDDLGIYLFSRSLQDIETQDLEAWTWLTSAYKDTAPNRQKTKYADHLVEMIARGLQCYNNVIEGVRVDDPSMVLENIEDSTSMTIKELLHKLNTEQSEYVLPLVSQS